MGWRDESKALGTPRDRPDNKLPDGIKHHIKSHLSDGRNIVLKTDEKMCAVLLRQI